MITTAKMYRRLVAAFVVTSMVAGCASTQPPSAVRSVNARLAASEDLGRQLDQRIQEVSSEKLMAQLIDESMRQLEPFNSRAYREALRRGQGASKALQQSIVTTDRASLLPLLALQAVDESAYKALSPAQRTTILVSSLEASEFFNVWGVPHLYWEQAAKVLIGEGREAEKSLSELLTDKRPAPVWGDEEVLAHREYQYRVCDYALILIQEIRGEPFTISTDPVTRDAVILEILGESE